MHPHASHPEPQRPPPPPPQPFAFDDDAPTPDPARDARLATLHAMHHFIAAHILRPARHGTLPPARTIAARLLVLQLLIDPHPTHSLRHYAKTLGMSHAALSLIGVSFAAALGLRAPWQRSDSACNAYSARARAVHSDARAALANASAQRNAPTPSQPITTQAKTLRAQQSPTVSPLVARVSSLAAITNDKRIFQ